ncbi:uncharacterized protein V1513DRAFT_254982 [Lipomyces chichibuensis]|uniref:uncharacterized protein n=1 Tax=Lipomyces chichibuensis TaxID=1546026 RepID=UPI0033435E52
MVLHNNKWDRKATRAYNRKHGISHPARDLRREEESSNDEEPDVSKPEASVSDSEDTSTVDDENTGSEAGTASSTVRSRRKKLPSNAWRYENLEADEQFGIENNSKDEEDAYLASIARPADGGLSKYLVDNEAKNLEEVRDIFRSQLDVGEALGWGKNRKALACGTIKGPEESKKKSQIVTYDAADPEYRDADRRIEKLKYSDTVRERYKSANRKEIDEELDRLKMLPKSVAAPILKERSTTGLQKGAAAWNEDFDNFWNEMEKAGTNGVRSAVVDEFTSKAATVRPATGAAPKKSRPATTSTPVKLSRTKVDADDKFLDDLLSGK